MNHKFLVKGGIYIYTLIIGSLFLNSGFFGKKNKTKNSSFLWKKLGILFSLAVIFLIFVPVVSAEIEIPCLKKVKLPYEIPLSEGWNLISLPEQPYYDNISKVLDSINNKYTDVFGYDTNLKDWRYRAFYMGHWFGDLDKIEATKGYWIKMKEPGVLKTTICINDSHYTIPLKKGINLIGWPCTSSQPLDVALKSIEGHWTDVFTYSRGKGWAFRSKYMNKWFGDLNEMKADKGYWIYVDSDVNLTVNCRAFLYNSSAYFIAGTTDFFDMDPHPIERLANETIYTNITTVRDPNASQVIDKLSSGNYRIFTFYGHSVEYADPLFGWDWFCEWGYGWLCPNRVGLYLADSSQILQKNILKYSDIDKLTYNNLSAMDVVFIAACESMSATELRDKFFEKGAKTYIGFERDIVHACDWEANKGSSGMDLDIGDSTVYGMEFFMRAMQGYSVNESFTYMESVPSKCNMVGYSNPIPQIREKPGINASNVYLI